MHFDMSMTAAVWASWAITLAFSPFTLLFFPVLPTLTHSVTVYLSH